MTTFSDPQNVQDHLLWRYATKVFNSSKIIEQDKLNVLLESLRLSPSSFGLQPWKFIVVQDSQTRELLRPHSWDQTQIVDCSHLVVLCARKSIDADYIESYVQDIIDTRSISAEYVADYKKLMLANIASRTHENIQDWTRRQVYIAEGFLLSTAASIGVDACPMEGFSPVEYDKILELENTDYTATVVTALGYRSDTDAYAHRAKVRFTQEEVIRVI